MTLKETLAALDAKAGKDGRDSNALTDLEMALVEAYRAKQLVVAPSVEEARNHA